MVILQVAYPTQSWLLVAELVVICMSFMNTTPVWRRVYTGVSESVASPQPSMKHYMKYFGIQMSLFTPPEYISSKYTIGDINMINNLA